MDIQFPVTVNSVLILSSYTVGTGSFPAIRAGLGDKNPTPSNADVKERIELCLYSPSVLLFLGYRVNYTFTINSPLGLDCQLIGGNF
jgi:hypothetical protein